MSGDSHYIASRPGIVKVVQIIFGIISLGCGGHSWDSAYVFERYFLGAVITCFVISLIDLAAFGVVRSLRHNQAAKLTDCGYQIIGAILLVVAGSLMIAAAKAYENEHCKPIPDGWGYKCQLTEEKLAAGSFALMNGLLYFLAAAFIATEKDDEMDFDMHRNYGGSSGRKISSSSVDYGARNKDMVPKVPEI